MAKAAAWTVTDAQARKRGEQIGLDTLVVHALNDEEQVPDAQARKRGEQIGLDTLVVHALNDEEQVPGVMPRCRS